MISRIIFFVPACICALVLFACGPEIRRQQAVLNTPEHHVSTGKKFLKTGRLNDALKEFRLAIDLDPTFSPAYVGLGLVYGFRDDFDNAFGNMKKAEQFAQGEEEIFNIHIAYMRLYTMGGEDVNEQWLDKVKAEYDEAIKSPPDSAALYYYMGLAYKQAGKYSDARRQFSIVLELNRSFVDEAKKESATLH